MQRHGSLLSRSMRLGEHWRGATLVLDLSTAWLATLLLIVFAIGTLCYRLFRNWGSDSQSILLKLMLIGVLVVILLITALSNPVPAWVVVLRIFAIHFSLFLTSITIDQVLNNKPYQSILYHKRVPFFMMLASTGALLAYIRETDALHDKPTAVYVLMTYSSYFVNYGSYLYTILNVIGMYWRSFRQNTNIPYMVRRMMCMAGMVCAAVSVGADATSHVFAPVLNPDLDLVLQTVSSTMIPITFTVLTMGFMTPHALLAWLLAPIERSVAYRQQRQQQQLSYLHRKVIQLVPSVQLHNNQLLNIRALIEISDARQIIWSQIPRHTPITPRDEARLLFYLLQRSTVIIGPGPYVPPPINRRSVVRYNLAVAAQLERLEASQPGSNGRGLVALPQPPSDLSLPYDQHHS